MAYQFAAREEFLVNTLTDEGQFYGDVAALKTGGFVAVWVDASDTPPGTSINIRARIFDASGAKTGGEFIVNTWTAGSQAAPSVTCLSNGNFVVSWHDASGVNLEEMDIKAQIFTPSGTKVGAEFLVNSTTENAQMLPSITALAGGSFVVTWQDLSETEFESYNWIIKAQIFSADGVKVGDEFQVNTWMTSFQVNPDVTALEDGGFVISWSDDSGPPEEYGDIQARIFSATGTPAGPQFRVNASVPETQVEPSLAGLAGGGFVATWQDYALEPGGVYGASIRAQVLAADGTRIGDPILVSTEAPGNQSVPDVAALENGGFVITWQDAGGEAGDTDEFAIMARVFDAGGEPVGDAFLVNVETAGGQVAPTVTGLKGGGFVIDWTDFSGTLGDSSNAAIKARIFAPDPTENADFLTGTPGADSIEALGGDDTVDGANGHDILRGGGGADIMYGGQLNDLLVGDDGNDSLYGGADIDTLRGEAGDDLLSGGAGGDSLNGGIGNDTLNGGERWDTLVGGQGNDWLDGGLDNDQMFGLAGDDTYVVDHIGDRVYEVPDEGYDTVRSSIDYALTPNVEALLLTGAADISGTGNGLSNSLNGNAGGNALSGGLGNDSLYGWDGDDSLTGGDDHDRLSGGNGSDTLIGGHGQDQMGGGGGADDFVFASVAVNGHDHVVDFIHGVDRLVFSGADYGFTAGHVLTASEFTQGSAAVGSSAQFVWDAVAQRLYWDGDGDGAGMAFELALISNGATVTRDDLVFT
jgi:Ca2+-binding RTX toxin-like protein